MPASLGRVSYSVVSLHIALSYTLPSFKTILKLQNRYFFTKHHKRRKKQTTVIFCFEQVLKNILNDAFGKLTCIDKLDWIKICLLWIPNYMRAMSFPARQLRAEWTICNSRISPERFFPDFLCDPFADFIPRITFPTYKIHSNSNV